MKHIIKQHLFKKTFLLFLSLILIYQFGICQDNQLKGAWRSEEAVFIFSDQFTSYAKFKSNPAEFILTYGGKYSVTDNRIQIMYEFNSADSLLVGQTKPLDFQMKGDGLLINNISYQRLDDGSPGVLSGAWLFSGRERDGVMSSRDTNTPRKTMKILSGTRFQWIAYNTETGQFFGTGGGTYTTVEGKYTEEIDFFSRDNTRVGASLSFDFEIKENVWHHKGFSSKGDPMYETWSLR